MVHRSFWLGAVPRITLRVFFVISFFGCRCSFSGDHSDPTPHLALRRQLAIAGADSAGPLVDGIMSATVRSTGEMYVSSRYFVPIQVISPAGGLLATVGNEGSGPGEFRVVGQIGCTADTLWVIDAARNQVSLFSPEGKHIRTLRTSVTAREPNSSYSIDAYIGNDSLTAWISSPTGRTVRRSLLLVDRLGQVLDTLFDANEWPSTVVLDGSRMGLTRWHRLHMPIPFPQGSLVATDYANRAIVVVNRASARSSESGTYTVTRRAFNGDVAYSVTLKYAPRRMPPAAVEDVIDEQYRALSRMHTRYPIPTRRAFTKHARQVLRIPAHQPPVTSVVLGRDSTVWLRREDIQVGEVQWVRLSNNGLPTAHLTTPVHFRILDVTADTLWASTVEDDGTTTLARYRAMSPSARKRMPTAPQARNAVR